MGKKEPTNPFEILFWRALFWALLAPQTKDGKVVTGVDAFVHGLHKILSDPRPENQANVRRAAKIVKDLRERGVPFDDLRVRLRARAIDGLRRSVGPALAADLQRLLEAWEEGVVVEELQARVLKRLEDIDDGG